MFRGKPLVGLVPPIIGVTVMVAMMVGSCDRGVVPHSDALSLVVADVLGNRSPEILAIGRSGVTVYDSAGRLRRQFALPAANLVFGTYADIDGDGKDDLLFGSRDAAPTRVLAMNGAGNPVFHSVVEDVALTFRELVPTAIGDGVVYAYARPSWPRSPRGVVAFNLHDSALRWVSYTPADPIAVALVTDHAGMRRIVVSSSSTAYGTFTGLGPARRAMPGMDAQARLYVLDLDGEPSGTAPTLFPKELVAAADDGDPRFLPAGGVTNFVEMIADSAHALVYYTPADEIPPAVHHVAAPVLVKVEITDGSVQASFRPAQGTIRAVAPWTHSENALAAVLVEDQSAFTVVLIDAELRAVVEQRVAAPPTATTSDRSTIGTPADVALSAVGPFLLVRTGTLVHVLGHDLSTLFAATYPKVRDAALLVDRSEIHIAVLAERLVVEYVGGAE